MNTTPIAEGKTKVLYPYTVAVCSKDVLTWGDQYQAPMPGKAVWSTTTTCNMFRLLRAALEDVAFYERIDETTFTAPYCAMIPLEVVWRGVIEPGSSYLALNPDVPVGVPLEEPIVQFFLKTSGKVFRGISLPCDDPLVARITNGGLWVHHPRKKVPEEEWVFIPADVFGYEESLTRLAMELTIRTKRIGGIIARSWQGIGWRVGDFKIEFGVTLDGRLLMADVLDNDSWRIQDQDGKERSKQTVRDDHKAGVPVEEIIDRASPNFALVARMSGELF